MRDRNEWEKWGEECGFGGIGNGRGVDRGKEEVAEGRGEGEEEEE